MDDKIRYSFEYWKNNDYDNKVFDELAEKFGIEKIYLKRKVKEYIRECNFTEEEKIDLIDLTQEKDSMTIYYRKIFKVVGGTTREQRINAVEKYCYDVRTKAMWLNQDMESTQKILNISFKTIKKMANNYMKKNNISIDTKYKVIDEKSKSLYRKRRQNVLFDALSEIPIEEEKKIIDLIEKSGLLAKYLKPAATDYVVLYKNDLKDTLIDELKAKINLYLKYKNQQNKEKRMLSKLKKKENKELEKINYARKIITDFINSDSKLIVDFIKKIDIDINEFKNLVHIIEIHDKELYDKYSAKIKEMKISRLKELVKTVKKIVRLIKNGIEENGVKRNFNLLDYYFITTVDLNKIGQIVNKYLKPEENAILNKFITENSNYRVYNNNMYNYICFNTEVGCKKDKDGKVIPNTVRIVTEEEKRNIIKYLTERKIPVNDKTTTLLLDRYLKGYISLPVNKYKTKVRKKSN